MTTKIKHATYGTGTIIEERGLFIKVKFDKDLPDILNATKRGAEKNTLTVGACACTRL